MRLRFCIHGCLHFDTLPPQNNSLSLLILNIVRNTRISIIRMQFLPAGRNGFVSNTQVSMLSLFVGFIPLIPASNEKDRAGGNSPPFRLLPKRTEAQTLTLTLPTSSVFSFRYLTFRMNWIRHHWITGLTKITNDWKKADWRVWIHEQQESG